MIYLLEGYEFNPSNVVEFLDTYKNIMTCYANFTMKKTIQNKLKLASQTNELIHTQWLRGIGKTHELIKFAKVNEYTVIENTHSQAQLIRERECYKEIYDSDVKLLKCLKINRNIVIDEGVTNIQELKDEEFNIITGFYTPKKENEMTFNERVIKTLVNEIEALTPKLQQTRENKDYGTYKNLINAYREVLNLMQSHMKDTMTRIG